MRYRPPRRRGWMLRIRLPYGDVVSSSRSRGNAKHQIYIEGVGFALIPRPDPFRVTRLAALRTEHVSGPVPGRPGAAPPSSVASRSRLAAGNRKRNRRDPNPTVNTTIRGGSTTATRRLSLPQPRARARRSHQATLYEECVLLPRSPLWHRALKVKHLAPHVGAVPRKLRRPPQLQQVLPLALGGRGIGELPAVEAP